MNQPLISVEGTLAEYEQKALKPDNYRPMIRSGDSGSNNSYLQKYSEDSIGQYFLLNADFKVVCPETFDDNEPSTTWEKDIENSQFAGFFKRAEYFEFNQKDYFSASEMYKKFATYSSSDKLRAMALEGLGRCFLFMDKYDEATRVYREVARNFGLLHNNAGQPFGIAAAFQLSELPAKEMKKRTHSGFCWFFTNRSVKEFGPSANLLTIFTLLKLKLPWIIVQRMVNSLKFKGLT